MKRRNVLIMSLVLVVVTAVATLAVSMAFDRNSLPAMTKKNGDGTVTISEKEYKGLLDAQKQCVFLEEKYDDLEDLQDYIKENYYKEVSDELLLEGAKKGLFQVLEDPYSVFMNPEEYESYLESTTGEFPGIGVYVHPNPDRGIEVISPIEDTPADLAGLKALDVIKSVNGIEYTHAEIDEAINNIRGEPGTDVTLTIYRQSNNSTFDVVITRDIIVVKVVKSEMLNQDIGYLRLTQFDNSAAEEFYEHMETLIASGADAVVIDLRNNPGGSLSECLAISDMLLPEGIICTTKGRALGSTETFESIEEHYDLPIALLIDEGSASASEILAGAIKDRNRGALIGTKSFGKGVVQIFMPYRDGTGLKLTTSEYFTPSGINIHGIGIEPNYMVELSEEYLSLENPQLKDDDQVKKAVEILKNELKKPLKNR